MSGINFKQCLTPAERQRAGEEDLSKVNFSSQDLAKAAQVIERTIRQGPPSSGLVQKALAARHVSPTTTVLIKDADPGATQTGFRFFPNWRIG
jgi:hypothetical protein